MYSTVPGIETYVMFSMSVNKFSGIEDKPFWRTTETKFGQPTKMPSPTFVTPLPITIEVSSEQYSKALVPIPDTESGIVIEVSAEQSPKA